MDETEIEEMRQEALADVIQSTSLGPREIAAKYAPGSLGCHEALHTASVAMDLFEGHVMEHPAIVINAEWFLLAARAQEALFALYEAIGQEHLPKSVKLEHTVGNG